MTSVDPSQRFTGPMAWDSDTAIPGEGVIDIDSACREEMLAIGEALRANPFPTPALRPEDFEMPRCLALGAKVREALDRGPGFAIVDRLPLEELGPEGATQIYWLVMSTVGRPVAQKWDGTLVYDVLDTGLKPAAGNGVRSSKSNAGQGYHTDNSFNLPPDHVGLLCLRPAPEGGESGLISFESVHNRLCENELGTLERLTRPFWFDRQREHAPDDALVSRHPAFSYDDGRLRARLSTGLVRQGYQVKGEPLDEESERALAVLDEVLESDELGKSFHFEAGQIQIVNNRRLGHRRTAFVDGPTPDQRRHLVRIWLRDHGRPFYLG